MTGEGGGASSPRGGGDRESDEDALALWLMRERALTSLNASHWGP
jgi:hypothetical protein